MNWIIEVTKKLKPFSDKKFLLAVSGGADSMALMQLFLHFREHFNFNFAVGYFHHGPTDSEQQLKFRAESFEFLNSQCSDHEVPFFTNYSLPETDFFKNFSKPLESEDEMRKARYDFFDQVMREQGLDYLVLGQHQEDLLETRMLRLIRGTGPEGLSAMSFKVDRLLRPLLDVSKEQLKQYLGHRKADFLEDPSNQSEQYLRNWLRNSWLPQLEERVPGASKSLHRSLDLLAQSLGQPVELDSYLEKDCLKVSELLPLKQEEKRQIIAAYMKSQGLRNYGLSHVNEVLKRLDREEKRHTFKLLGHCWNVDAGRMRVQEQG